VNGWIVMRARTEGGMDGGGRTHITIDLDDDPDPT
jgi:hypothetical protein